MHRLWTVAIFGLWSIAVARAQGVTTVAGSDLIYPPPPLAATSVPLSGAGRLVIDSRGNIYISVFYDLAGVY